MQELYDFRQLEQGAVIPNLPHSGTTLSPDSFLPLFPAGPCTGTVTLHTLSPGGTKGGPKMSILPFYN
jgi:hypothetical protein